MNDFDLDSQLKALRTPERSGEYWTDFPGRVTEELRSRPLPRPVRSAASSWLPQLAWGCALALGCFALGYFIGHDDTPKGIRRAVLENQREIRLTLVTFPKQMQAMMQDEHGLQKLVKDQP